MRLLLGMGATVLSAVLYALAFAPASIRPLAWLALVPFFLALRTVRGVGPALLLGWLWPVAASSFVADALPAAVEQYFLQPRAVALLFAVGVWTVTGSLYTMPFALAFRALARIPSPWRPLLFAAAWTASELARGRLMTHTSFFVGNPWALLAYSQAGWLELLQIASLTGVYGVTFVVASVNAGVAELVAAVAARSGARSAALGLGLASLPALGALAFGVTALRAAGREEVAEAVPIAIVQGDVSLGSVWRSDLYGKNLDVYLRLTLEAFTRGDPAIVFWPEAAFTFFLEDEPLYRSAIGRVLAQGSAELVAGGPTRVGGGESERYRNSVFLIDGDGVVGARYDKRHLLPFTEHFPLRSSDFLRRRFERVRVFEHGVATAPLPTRAGPAGVLVCNEAMLPELARQRVREGAEYLVSPSNDSWIRYEKWASMMFDLVSLRAVEQRRWLVRASTSGPSAVVDPWGRVQVRTAAMTRGVVLGSVHPRRELSLYARVGDAFGFACAAAVALALVAQARTSSDGSAPPLRSLSSRR